MGRVKLKIQRLESMSNRQNTYGKRRAGILKKAQEISVLCDIDIILLMFSPTGKPSIFRGQHSNIDEMIAKYAQLSPKERTKSFWTNPDKIEDIEHLCQMENSLRESLDRIHMQKSSFQLEILGNDQLMPLDCTSQVEYGMHFPLMTGGDQDGQTQTWFPNVERQHMMLPDEPHFLSCRDIVCSRDTSLPSCSGLFGAGKEADLCNSKLVDIEREDGITINDYANSSAQLRLPLGEQYSYHSYGNLSFPEMMEPKREVNFQESTMDYQINGNFELPRSIYNDLQHSLVPASGSSAMCNLNDNSYQQPPNHLNN
ncbi:AGAMOUS-like 65 [Forsythia ovata]|uniref:AGAMOUS-like 65 n=1 Tax=Forsythia ovata TaxID=205694 RepID=A0ABD1TTK7_9LAMI